MNLNELWAGQDYAYYEYKGRNEPLRRNAPRVKVIRAFKQQRAGNERASGYAEVMYVNKETGEPIMDYEGKQKIRTVRARDIAMVWEQYVDEMDHQNAVREREQREYEERERTRREEREARLEQERIEREAKEKAERERLEGIKTQLYLKYNIPPDWVIDITNQSIRLDRIAVEQALGVTNAELLRRGW